MKNNRKIPDGISTTQLCEGVVPTKENTKVEWVDGLWDIPIIDGGPTIRELEEQRVLLMRNTEMEVL